MRQRSGRPAAGAMAGAGVLVATAAIAAALLAPIAAHAQGSNVRVRGTISSFDGKVLAVQARDGKTVEVSLPENVTVSATKKITLADIKPGDYVGVTSVKRPDGTVAALEVHVLPPVAPAGHFPWDLEPGSMMTNGNVSAKVAASAGNELTLDYKSGTQKVLVPEGAPVAATEPGDRSMLKPGESVFMIAQAAPDGKLSAARVQVSHNGVKPPQ